MHTLLLTFLTFLLLTISGCGGGSSGESNSSSTTNDSSSSSLSVVNSSGIEGLKIICAAKEVSTEIDGSFECNSLPIEVYIRDFKIGEVKNIPLDYTLYTQDILNVSRGAIADQDVMKISMILQSLDEDASPLNGITLTDDTLSLLSLHLSYDTNLSELTFEDINDIIKDVIASRLAEDKSAKLRAVDYNTAQSNLTIKTASAPALPYAQRSVGRGL